MSTSPFFILSAVFIASMAAGAVYAYRRYKRFLRRCPRCQNRHVIRTPQVYSKELADKPLAALSRAKMRVLRVSRTAGARLAAFRELFEQEQCAVYIFRRCPRCGGIQWYSYDSGFPWWRLAYMARYEPECFEHQPALFKLAGLDDPHTFIGKPHPPILPLHGPAITIKRPS